MGCESTAALVRQVFFAVAVFLGEGMYHFFKIFAVSMASFLMHSAASKRAMPRTAVDVAAIDVRPCTWQCCHSSKQGGKLLLGDKVRACSASTSTGQAGWGPANGYEEPGKTRCARGGASNEAHM